MNSEKSFVVTEGKLEFTPFDEVITVKEYIETLNQYVLFDNPTKNIGKHVLSSDTKLNESIIKNGFITTGLQAYNFHKRLVLTPDTVWICITNIVANVINRNPEKFRNLFVNHSEKEELNVYGMGSFYTANYEDLINKMSEEINKRVKNDTREWFECNFSTSTNITKTVSKLMLMGAMQNYFEYKMTTMCGIPEVILKGTLNDWELIVKKIKVIKSWNDIYLDKWVDVLTFVLTQFVNSYIGKIDKDFWNRISQAGPRESGTDYIQGWILAFCPFSDEGKYILNDLEYIKKTNIYGRIEKVDIPTCHAEIPVTVIDESLIEPKTYKAIFYAGCMGSTNLDENTITASVDYAMYDVTNI